MVGSIRFIIGVAVTPWVAMEARIVTDTMAQSWSAPANDAAVSAYAR